MDCNERMRQINAHMSVPLDIAMRFISQEHDLSEMDWWRVYAMRANKDEASVRSILVEVDARSSRTAMVYRYDRGVHYSTLGRKFLSLTDAQDHLSRNGYRFGGVRVHRLPREGD